MSLAVSNKDLVMFLKERKLKSIREMKGLADQYIEAHEFNKRYTLISFRD